MKRSDGYQHAGLLGTTGLSAACVSAVLILVGVQLARADKVDLLAGARCPGRHHGRTGDSPSTTAATVLTTVVAGTGELRRWASRWRTTGAPAATTSRSSVTRSARCSCATRHRRRSRSSRWSTVVSRAAASSTDRCARRAGNGARSQGAKLAAAVGDLGVQRRTPTSRWSRSARGKCSTSCATARRSRSARPSRCVPARTAPDGGSGADSHRRADRVPRGARATGPSMVADYGRLPERGDDSRAPGISTRSSNRLLQKTRRTSTSYRVRPSTALTRRSRPT